MKLRAAVAALGAVLLTACQAPSSNSPAPRPSASTTGLAAADARLFAGDYEGAETAYRSLVDAGADGAGAHYALLLDYESRFREAVKVAAADVDRHPSSANLARLVRAYDWSADLPAALEAGLRAVRAQPVDPLARLFYSEALADAGRFAEAESQLHAVEGASGDAYLRSELYREWANYYRDRGDAASELNNLELSIRRQPRFPERQLELARHHYAAKRLDLAHAAIDRAAADSRSGALLAAAADAALMAGDFDAAGPRYQAAREAAPTIAQPVLGLAVIAVAGKRDFKAAHDALLGALRADPTQGAVYEFLANLDRYVLKIDPAGDLSGLPAGGGSSLDAARRQALAAVNAMRQAAGVRPLSADPALDAASEEHAWYTVFNLGQQSLAGLGVHAEDPSLPGFVGSNSILRDRAAGYAGDRSAEVINHVFTPQAAVAVWQHSVYHRYPLLGANSRAAGYGEADIGPLAVAVMDIGVAAGSEPDPVVYPVEGQRDVPAAFTGNEIPDPAPQGTRYPTGYPVTLQTGISDGLAIASARLTGPDGKEVAAWTLEPNKQVDGNEWCLLPQQPLHPGQSYTVEVAGTIDGRQFTRRWTFTTAASA